VRIARFLEGDCWRTGIVEGDEIADLGTVDAALGAASAASLAADAGALDTARSAARKAVRFPLSQVRLGAPVMPRKFLGLGLCYASHAREMERRGMTIPTHQVWFNKQVTALNGPYDDVQLPTGLDAARL
jgi:2-keto-4-pentenoate hydratase/2-oxohepta-3-ene-1,7-dioic acid hydratase in catechol pathway